MPYQEKPTDFIDVLKNIQPLSLELEEAITIALEPVTIRKHRFFVEQGQVCDYLWYLSDGIACSWLELPEGKDETVTRIMTPGYIVVAPKSFYKQLPSLENIEALKDCKAFRIRKDDLNNIYKRFPEFNYNTRLLTEHYTCMVTDREYMLRIHNVTDRFTFFKENFAYILEHVSEKYAASFADMDTTTFNKLKNNKYNPKGGG